MIVKPANVHESLCAACHRIDDTFSCWRAVAFGWFRCGSFSRDHQSRGERGGGREAGASPPADHGDRGSGYDGRSLPRTIGHALERAYKGELDTHRGEFRAYEVGESTIVEFNRFFGAARHLALAVSRL
jgi:hypothetical protein